MKLMLVDYVEKRATKFINAARMVQRFEATVLILNAEKLQKVIVVQKSYRPQVPGRGDHAPHVLIMSPQNGHNYQRGEIFIVFR
jgi:hypothetical protein